MKNRGSHRFPLGLCLLVGCLVSGGPSAEPVSARAHSGGEAGEAEQAPDFSVLQDNETTSLFRKLGRNAIWKLVGSTPMAGWTTFHTQGMLKIEDTFYVSSVEILEPTVRNATTTDALYDFSIDRSEGKGRGWLFKFDAQGALLGRVELTDGAIYHPGGIDYDGKHIWVPVAEYRPNSRSQVYRVDPKTLQADLVLHHDDHIGGVVYNRHRGTIHGVSWGSRRLYTFSKHRRGTWKGTWVPNPATYVDYQDCHYQGVQLMLCGGVASYSTPSGSIAFGGLELMDLKRNRLEHQIPVNHFLDDGAGIDPTLSLSHNAFWAEPLADGRTMRIYFMTERDNQADLLTYDVTPWIYR